jgi:hypothetical protein
MRLYEDTNWSDTGVSSTQSAILTITDPQWATPWWDALIAANLIRSAITLNFNDAAGRTTCRQLAAPAPQNPWYSYPLISASARLDYYGNRCQGTRAGITSPCNCGTGFANPAQNILNRQTANGEVFHPQDLTAAMTQTNNWHTTYRNQWIKVTSLVNTSLSIVVRVTDNAPSNRGVELSDRAYRAIGNPGAANNRVKIEHVVPLI